MVYIPGRAMWEIEFYEKSNGDCPVRAYLDGLSPITELPIVLRQIGLLSEHGYRLDRPHSGYLRDDIYELRVKTRRENIRILYFFFDREKIVLTHGFLKKAARVRDAEIDKAIEYRQDYYERDRRAKR
jgi:phage-related protein